MNIKKSSKIPTPHNRAKYGEIAKTVLMPGDPLRAKFIAENFLEDVFCFNKVRNMLGYTGMYEGEKVSVMGSGMGMPSIGIYSYELFNFYDVDNIIRVGSCGAYVKELELFDIILTTAAYSESTFAKVQNGYDKKYTFPSKYINDIIRETAKKNNIKMKEEKIVSGDVFYTENTRDKVNNENKNSIVTRVFDMESFALFANATVLGKNAACILTVSDSISNGQIATYEQRETAFTTMIELGLKTAINL